MLLSNIRFSAVRRHPNRRDAAIHSHFKVIHRTDTGQQQCGDLRVLHLFAHSRQILLVTGRRKTVIDRRATQPVAVRNFNHRYPRLIHGLGNRDHLLDGDLMLLRMHAVAQAHVMNSNFFSAKVHALALSYLLSTVFRRRQAQKYRPESLGHTSLPCADPLRS